MCFGFRAALLVVLTAGPVVARDPLGPAELPPPDYAGQQYVDSKGCMFVRAGTQAEVLWIPRVSRDGKPLCDSPPSGQRVPIVDEVGVQDIPAASPAPESGISAPPVLADAAQGGFFVAVGSFGQPENADKADATLRALDFGVVRGRLQGGSGALITVFAGPFPDAIAAAEAQDALREGGFPDAMTIGP